MHRLVVGGLVLSIATGLLLFASDVETFLRSWVFWLKLGMICVLLGNGYAMTRAEKALREDAAEDVAGVDAPSTNRTRERRVCGTRSLSPASRWRILPNGRCRYVRYTICRSIDEVVVMGRTSSERIRVRTARWARSSSGARSCATLRSPRPESSPHSARSLRTRERCQYASYRPSRFVPTSEPIRCRAQTAPRSTRKNR